MRADWTAELLDQLEFHWEHQLRPRIDGLTDDEYFWEPVPGAWGLRWSTDPASGERRLRGEFTVPPPDPPPVTTLGWRLHHLVGVLEGWRARDPFGGPPWDFAAATAAPDAHSALARLDDAVQQWTAAVRTIDPDGIAAPAGADLAGRTVAWVVLHVNREILHHGAEIALLRDLYRTLPTAERSKRLTRTEQQPG